MTKHTYQIMTIDAKSLFKYYPKKPAELDKPFCFDARKRTLYNLVVKAENEFEECPMLHQFLEVLKQEKGNKFKSADINLLHDKFLIMDFGDIFMPLSEKSTPSARKNKERLQNNVNDIMSKGLKIQFDTHDVLMMPFDKSGNMSRNGRISFVNSEYAERLNERLNLGIDFGNIPVILSKYYAYRGLYLSTSQRVNHKEFKLTPKTIVIINDVRPASGARNLTKVAIETAEGKISNSGEPAKDWVFLPPTETENVPVTTPYDGEGLITEEYTKLINEALGVKGANSFQIRMPFAKGMLHQVDIISFIDEYTVRGMGEEKYLYKDAFGIDRNLKEAHILLTESMFKGKDWLVTYCKKNNIEDPMQYYCDTIEKFNHGFYVSGTNLPYGHSEYTHLSYQAINTLAFNDEQFDRIMEGHNKFIKNPIEFLKSWDEVETEENFSEDGVNSNPMPNWQRALLQNPSLAGIKYIKEQLENVQQSLLSKIALGKILVEGQIRYLCRDLAPLMFSLLREDEDIEDAWLRNLYSRFYLPQGGNNKLNLNFEDHCAFFRNPHLSRNEQYIMRAFVPPKSEDKYAKDGRKNYIKYMKYINMYEKYFSHLTGIVMVPTTSPLPLCLGGADFDGDLVTVITNQDVVNAVAKGVYKRMESPSLFYYERELSAISIPTTKAKAVEVPKFVEYDHVYNTFSNYIGKISNKAIAIGQVEYDRNNTCKAEFDANTPTCSKCTILTGLEIDAAKNGVHPNLDIILKADAPNSAYLSFLKKYRKLKAEKYFHVNKINLKTEDDGKITISVKSCQTDIEWNPENEAKGTYINLLPKYFMEYYNAFKQSKREPVKPNMPKLSKKEKELYKDFMDSCKEIMDLYLFYRDVFLKYLKREKEKGYYVVENTEVMIMRRYDDDCIDEKLFDTLQSVRNKISDAILDKSSIEKIRERINTEQWIFQPLNKRGQTLEKIIGNGFEESKLTAGEKELLFHFHQQGYKMLWRILDLIEGPKTVTFDEVHTEMKESRRELGIADCVIETALVEELKRYYEKNAVNSEQLLYAICLGLLMSQIENARNYHDDSEVVTAVYELSKNHTTRSKFFWDMFSWEQLQPVVGGIGGKNQC